MAVILKLSLLRIVFSVERNVIVSCRVDSRVAYRLLRVLLLPRSALVLSGVVLWISLARAVPPCVRARVFRTVSC